MNTKTKKVLAAVSIMLVICLMFSGCSLLGTTDGTEAAEGDSSSGTIQLILTVVVFGVVIYFFMIRPEKKRKKQAEELRSSLSVGDPVVTIGGLTGKIVAVTDDSLVFETSEDRVRIEVKKWAISKKDK